MKIVLVSNNPQDGDALKKELNELTSAISVEAVLNSQNAYAYLASSACKAIVLDASVPATDAANLISATRLTKKSVAIVALVATDDKYPPTELIRAGVDKYISKSPGFVSSLEQALFKAMERHQEESAQDERESQITDEKAEGQSREESLRQVIETLPIGVTVISPDGTFLAINQAGMKLLGAERLDQIIGNSIVRLLPQEERDKVISFLSNISQGTDSSVQLDWRGADGTISPTELRAVPMRRGPAGTIVALAVIAAAANGRSSPAPSNLEEELKKAQSGQAAADEQLAVLKDSLEDAEARCERLIEEQRTERAGWEQARDSYKEQCAKIESMAQALRDAQESLLETHDTERAKWESRFQEIERKKKDVEAQLERITEESQQERSKWDAARLESEQKLREAEEQRSLLDAVLQEAQTGLAQMEENFSAERSEWELVRQDLEQKLQAAEAQSSMQNTTLQEAQSALVHLEETLSTERSRWALARQEFEQKLLDTEQKYAAERKSILSDAESRIAAIQEQNKIQSNRLNEVHQEIEQLKADRQKLTTELAETRLRYQRLSQVSTVGFVMAARDGRVLECNDAAARMFGFSGTEEALAATGEDEFRIYPFEGMLAARLEQEGRLENIEWSSQGRDGRVVRFQENARLVEAPAGSPHLVERVLTDITRIHRLGEEIRRTRRLESTGDLASATVRSLKSLCATLENCGKSLMGRPDDADAVRQTAETLMKNARRGIKHTEQFLSISAKADRIPGLINLNEILAKHEPLLRSLAGEDIDLQTVLSPYAGLVTANKQELIQLTSSLVASSREALPLGGTVIIEIANVDVDAAAGNYPSETQSGTYVQMTISADGCVVHPERRTASNRMIVERLGGWMQTTNSSEDGNLHQVYLPRVEQFGSANRP